MASAPKYKKLRQTYKTAPNKYKPLRASIKTWFWDVWRGTNTTDLGQDSEASNWECIKSLTWVKVEKLEVIRLELGPIRERGLDMFQQWSLIEKFSWKFNQLAHCFTLRPNSSRLPLSWQSGWAGAHSSILSSMKVLMLALDGQFLLGVWSFFSIPSPSFNISFNSYTPNGF